ncbi:MAG TPA: cyclic pyranopterin monophosphate synthase MoaC [Candidatus Micrarchaeia archaeon]|nr:cyclic pyranopterin monophosphate synthase MoaC [Candidatus Micrarchaeia archaeon]
MTGDPGQGARPLSHVGESGEVRMVDVSDRAPTTRRATARGLVRCSPLALAAIREGTAAKGDVLLTCRLAGIQAAKRTPELIPLCHPLAVTHVDVTAAVDEPQGVRLAATVRCQGPTGVEMEALTAVAVAALTVIDMVKAVDPWASVAEVALEEKSGGRSGHLRHPKAGQGSAGPG